MSTITTLKKFTRKDDVVVIPRQEYETLVAFKKWKEFIPTKAQKESLIRAEMNLRAGKTISYHELCRKMGLTN